MPLKRSPSIESAEPLRSCCFQTDVGFLYTEVDTKLTGIPSASLWCPAGEFTRHLSHEGPRVIVARPTAPCAAARQHRETRTDGSRRQVALSTPSIVIGSLPPGLAQAATRFVDRNVDILLAHWGGGVDSSSLMQGVRREAPCKPGPSPRL
jgi:hypothetical protein